jgi:hypothetical protein
MFGSSKHFLPSLVLEIKAGACLTEAPFGAPLYGKLLALPTSIKLDWKGLSGSNTLAYYEHSQIMTA